MSHDFRQTTDQLMAFVSCELQIWEMETFAKKTTDVFCLSVDLLVQLDLFKL